MHKWRWSEGPSREPVLPFYHMALRTQLRLGSKRLYTLSHLASPSLFSSVSIFFPAVGTEPGGQHVTGKHPTTELCPSSFFNIVNSFYSLLSSHLRAFRLQFLVSAVFVLWSMSPCPSSLVGL